MIYIIIPVHDRKEFSCQCLLALQQQTYKDFKVIVVDDGSTDGTAEMIKNEFSEVHIISGDGNLWWTGATNLGLKYVLSIAKDEDYVLTLNNDLYVDTDYLEKINNTINKKTKCLIGSVSIDAENRNIILDAGVRINWKTAKFDNIANKTTHFEDLSKENDFQSVDTLPGRGTLIPINVFKEIGVFNEKLLPHYGADYEFAIRAKKNGYNLFVYNKSIVYSYSKETGLNNSINNISWNDFIKSYFSIKSPNNIKYRWQFAKLCPPLHLRLSFFLIDFIRVTIGPLKNQFIFKKHKYL